jgi:signal transduction histidine kinase
MAAGVAHELRNPLGAISNSVYFLNMVLEEVEPGVREALAIVDKEVRTCERIIQSLLNFARIKSPLRQELNVNAVLRTVLSRIALPENVQLAYQPDEDLPIILADPNQLDIILGNLILNAVQAMPGGGRLRITTKAPDSEWVAVSISDTGVGIPGENLEQIFEPFFTTKARGIGLGLALVRDLVVVNGGSIEVQSQVGQGSVFTVRLPLAG